LTNEAKDLIEKLMEKNPARRLGSYAGINEIMRHPWLNVNYDEILKSTV
jgi:hypothetical protein